MLIGNLADPRPPQLTSLDGRYQWNRNTWLAKLTTKQRQQTTILTLRFTLHNIKLVQYKITTQITTNYSSRTVQIRLETIRTTSETKWQNFVASKICDMY